MPIADRLAGELERHFQASRRREENHLVFAHPVTGHVRNASKPSRQFYVALERASVHHVPFRGLRHTLGTQMATLGAPMRAIQEWMGDANITDDRGLLALRADPTGGVAFAQKAFGDAMGALPGRRACQGL